LIPSSREVLIEIQLDAQATCRDWRPVEAHHVDAAEFMHPMTVAGSSATAPRARGAPPYLAGSLIASAMLRWYGHKTGVGDALPDRMALP
jgi:hypothetical protein